MRLAAIFFIGLIGLVACSNGSDSGGPDAVVTTFYQRLAKFDTAGMTELVCPEIRADTESGIGMLQSLIGLGGSLGVDAKSLSLEDFHATTISSDGQQAKVQVTGRLNAGIPLGSTSLDGVEVVKREGNRWCLTASKGNLPTPGATSSKDSSAGIAAEQDKSTSLPGQFVNLEKIYGAEFPATAGHVSHAVDYSHTCAADDSTLCNTNPPVGGPHWSAACGDDPTATPPFCGPAPWGIYRQPWQPETLVHNMEHGGVVIWYNTANQQVISDLETLVTARLTKHDLLVLVPYPNIEADTIALTSWTRIDKFAVAQYDTDRINKFISSQLRRFNPEHF